MGGGSGVPKTTRGPDRPAPCELISPNLAALAYYLLSKRAYNPTKLAGAAAPVTQI